MRINALNIVFAALGTAAAMPHSKHYDQNTYYNECHKKQKGNKVFFVIGRWLHCPIQDTADGTHSCHHSRIPVVIGETHPETEQVFIDKAKECNSPIYFADQVFDCDKIHIESDIVQKYDIWKNSELYMEALELPLMGNYQQKNLTTVMCALDLLRDKFNLSEDDIRDGIGRVIRNTHLMGRWQILNRDPLTIADTGHNVAGITEVVKQLAEMNYEKLHFVLGMVNDKDIDSVLQLLPHGAEYYFCKADIPRGLDANILAQKAFDMGLRGQVFESVSHAYRSAVNNAHFDDVVFIGGSNFTVAEVV
jgi:dihydrofolate synthase/folylpolyglutamate synthase